MTSVRRSRTPFIHFSFSILTIVGGKEWEAKLGGLSIFAEAASRFLSTPPVQVELEEAVVRFNLGPGGGGGGGEGGGEGGGRGGGVGGECGRGGHLLPFKPLQLQLVQQLLSEIGTSHLFVATIYPPSPLK